MNVRFDGEWSLRNKTVLLGVYEMVKKCEYKFLGDLKINDKTHQSVAIPSGKKVILRTVYLKRGKERTQDFLFIPKKDQTYDVSIYEREGLLGNSVYQLNNNKRIEVDQLNEKCAHR